MAALFEWHVAPRLVAGFTRRGNQPAPPDFLAGHGIEGNDDAGVGAAVWQATSPGDGLAVGDDRPRALDGGVLAIVEDRGI